MPEITHVSFTEQSQLFSIEHEVASVLQLQCDPFLDSVIRKLKKETGSHITIISTNDEILRHPVKKFIPKSYLKSSGFRFCTTQTLHVTFTVVSRT
jgi:hypothetical protein